jgi:predicted signal transduction protein with EAL and GGDEF domain
MVPPILVDGVPCRVGASLGAAVYPDDAADLSGLLARADAAMYEAKRIRRREVAR